MRVCARDDSWPPRLGAIICFVALLGMMLCFSWTNAIDMAGERREREGR